MWALIDAAMTTKTEYELADPKQFVDDPEYANVSPLALIATMKATHSMLLNQHKWPALTGQLPQSNHSSANGRPGPGTPSTSAPLH